MYIVKEGKDKPETRGAKTKYPFGTMAVGDHFDVPARELSHSTRCGIYTCAKFRGMRAAIRLIESEGVYRVWRVK